MFSETRQYFIAAFCSRTNVRTIKQMAGCLLPCEPNLECSKGQYRDRGTDLAGPNSICFLQCLYLWLQLSNSTTVLTQTREKSYFNFLHLLIKFYNWTGFFANQTEQPITRGGVDLDSRIFSFAIMLLSSQG